MEAIACFIQENLEQAEMPLPVPGDRQRLIEARALLEQNYGQEGAFSHWRAQWD